MALQYSFEAVLWRWAANTAWVFVTVPSDPSDEIDDVLGAHAAGFGSHKVAVRIGVTSWRTSIFPSTEHGGFVLPIKKSVRAAQEIDVDDTVLVHLEVL